MVANRQFAVGFSPKYNDRNEISHDKSGTRQMSDTEESDLDKYTSEACQSSVIVQDLLESGDPEAKESYNTFYNVATKALDLNDHQLQSLEEECTRYVNEVSQKLVKLENLEEDTTQFQEEAEKSKKNLEELNAQYEQLKIVSDKLHQKAQKCTVFQKVPPIISSITEIDPKIPDILSKIREEKDRQEELIRQIDQVEHKISELQTTTQSKLKKNKRRANELEMKMRRSSSNNSLFSEEGEKEMAKKSEPSMIIHRTQDSAADDVRLLRGRLEEVLKTNSSVKAQLKNLQQDLEAMREENSMLKILTRNFLDNKK